MNRRRRWPTLGVVLLAAAVAWTCDESGPVGPTVPLDQRFTIGSGESVAVQGTPLQVTFARVSRDSRCPADVVCIQAGDAAVLVRVSQPQPSEHELHTHDSPKRALTPSGYHIELIELLPYPFSSRPILPGDYRATLLVTH